MQWDRIIELAWASGLFDGEGTFYVMPLRLGGTRSMVAIGQNDREVLDRFQEAVRVGKVYGPYIRKKTNAIYFQYRAINDDARQVRRLLTPFLSSTKRRQSEKFGVNQ